jgi:hypothetical protein
MTTSFHRVAGAVAMLGLLSTACGSAPDAETTTTPESASSADAGAGAGSPPARITPGVSVNAIMVGLVDHAAHNLWNVEQENRAPKSEDDWEIIAEHAIQIVAAGPAITSGGTGVTDNVWADSASWRNYAQQMSNAGGAAFNAARERNLDALVKANGELVQSCESCHKEFKPELPSEGIVHGHAHDAGQ